RREPEARHVLARQGRPGGAEARARVPERQPGDVQRVDVAHAPLLEHHLDEEVLLAAGRAVELDAVARAGPVDRDAEAVVADAPQELEDAVDVERVLEARRRVVAEDEPAT